MLRAECLLLYKYASPGYCRRRHDMSAIIAEYLMIPFTSRQHMFQPIRRTYHTNGHMTISIVIIAASRRNRCSRILPIIFHSRHIQDFHTAFELRRSAPRPARQCRRHQQLFPKLPLFQNYHIYRNSFDAFVDWVFAFCNTLLVSSAFRKPRRFHRNAGLKAR